MNNLTARELIKALQTLNPDSEVLIDIHQSNKVYGVVRLPIQKSPIYKNSAQLFVNATYNGATIIVHLPSGAFISKLPK